MVTIDAGFAAWLKADALKLAAATGAASRWPSQGVKAMALSPFATVGGAAAEGQRRSNFLQNPTVRDRVVVDGEARSLIGRCIEIVSDSLDYAAAGELVFVLKVEEQANNTSVLSVLRRLA